MLSKMQREALVEVLHGFKAVGQHVYRTRHHLLRYLNKSATELLRSEVTNFCFGLVYPSRTKESVSS